MFRHSYDAVLELLCKKEVGFCLQRVIGPYCCDCVSHLHFPLQLLPCAVLCVEDGHWQFVMGLIDSVAHLADTL
jgi:hypothetical protein